MSKYINADKALEHLKKELYEFYINSEIPIGRYEVIVELAESRLKEWIDLMPSADIVEVKHSWWSKVSPFNYQCMNCSALSSIEFNFCPNCGADMREGKETE